MNYGSIEANRTGLQRVNFLSLWWHQHKKSPYEHRPNT